MMDEICSLDNLRAGFQRVAKNKGSPGIDGVTVEEFGVLLEENLAELVQKLKSGRYQPQPLRRVMIPKPGSQEKRPLGIPAVRDRVVQAATLQVLEPLFEPRFAEHSYGFRPGKGCLDALLRVDYLLKDGFTQVLDADVTKYFDTIPHDRLLELMRMRVPDERVIGLIRAFLEAGVLKDTTSLWSPDQVIYPDLGTPQGGVISPLLANIYLDPLDHLTMRQGYEMVRYADDFLVACRSCSEANAAKEVVEEWMSGAGLTLHPDKTNIRSISQIGNGFDFLGYHFDQEGRWPREKSIRKLKTTIEKKTKRSRRGCLEEIIKEVNQVLTGWFEYFRHSTEAEIFHDLDSWTADKLRNLLRVRLRAGKSHSLRRWSNAYFTDRGLFSMSEAYSMATTRIWH